MSASYLKVWVDWLDKYRKLNDTEFGRLVRAALQYKNSGEVTRLPSREEILLDGILLDIDRDAQTELALSVARAEAGRKGNDIRWKNGKNRKCDNAIANNRKLSLNKKKNKEEEKEKEKEGQEMCGVNPADTHRFTPPSVEEVQAYCADRRNDVDAQRFVDFYSAKGWMVGKNRMQDWRACVRTWERGGGTGGAVPARNEIPFAWMMEDENASQ